jgi:hypothetical protein
MEVRCSIFIKDHKDQTTQEDCILAWVPRVGEKIIRDSDPFSHLKVEEVRHAAKDAVSGRPEPHVQIYTSRPRLPRL